MANSDPFMASAATAPPATVRILTSDRSKSGCATRSAITNAERNTTANARQTQTPGSDQEIVITCQS